MAQRPGDVVDQDVLFSEQHRRAQYTMGHAARSQRRFHFGFATEISEVGINIRIGDADMNNAPHPRIFRRLE